MAGTELAKAYVQIIPSARGIKAQLENQMGGDTDSAGLSLGKRLGSAIKGAIASAAIGKAIAAAVSEGADLQQSIGGIETLFKESAEKVKQNAAEAYRTAGMSANEYMELTTSFSASLLQSLGNDTAKAADVADMAMVDMSDNMNKMGSNMEDIKNAYQGFAKQNYTMLDNLKLGYGGTKTEMERLLADAQKITGIEYNIDNLADVYSAIHVIQGELDITGTTAKEAATTLSGSLGAVKAAFKNVIGNLAIGEDIKDELLALQETVSTFFVGNLLPMIGNVLMGIPDMVKQAISIAVLNINLISGNADQIVAQGIQFVASLVSGIITGIPYLMESGLKLVTAFGSAIINTDWIAVGTDMVNNLKSGLDLAAGEILGTDGNIINSVTTAITENLPVLLEKGNEIILNIANGIMMNSPQLITSAGTMISEFIAGILPMLPIVLQAGADLLLNLVNGIISNLPQIAASAASAVAAITTTIGQNLPQILQSGIEIIGKLAAGLIRAIPTLVGKIPEIITSIRNKFEGTDWGSIGMNIIRGIANGLSSAADQLWDAVKGVLGGFKENVLAFFGIKSPSRWGKYVGEMIDAGIAGGVTGNLGIISDAAREVKKSAAIPFSSEMTYSVSGKLNGARTESSVLEKLDRLIALLEILAYSKENETTKGTLSQREVIRILRDWGVVIE